MLYDTVGRTLKRLGIVLEENDVLPFDNEEYIFQNQTISIPKIETRMSTVKEPIIYKTKILESDEMLDGEKTVVQNGSDGIKAVTYKQYFFFYFLSSSAPSTAILMISSLLFLKTCSLCATEVEL